MPKPVKFIYEKKAPFRDAFYFIIVCEGQNREPDYFHFFDGISSRIKIVPVESLKGASNPSSLISNAIEMENALDARAERDTLWFVIDTDRWGSQLHKLRGECDHHTNWFVAQSNPCFEVWLYFHFRDTIPELTHPDHCRSWKPIVNQVIQGGFNSDLHPIFIETAINNSKSCYSEVGYFPQPGSTQVWRLSEQLLLLIKKDLEKLKARFLGNK